jgi:replication-associated recombination protein RarA
MIFWGPPGVGKTTLANIIAQTQKGVVLPIYTNNIILEFNEFLRISINDCFRPNITTFLNRYDKKTVALFNSLDNFNKSPIILNVIIVRIRSNCFD